MTENEFKIINKFIMESLEKENPFITTSGKLLTILKGKSNPKGNNEFYESLLKYCEEFKVPYNMEGHFITDDDTTIDIRFYK